jgi:hypothetical protein
MEFHIMADSESQAILTTDIALVRNPQYDIKMVFYPVTVAGIEARLARTAQKEEGKPEFWKALGSHHDAGTREFKFAGDGQEGVVARSRSRKCAYGCEGRKERIGKGREGEADES